MLPSGKVVDQSTIDKHSEEEAKWGRLPSDPFTGLEYTSQRKAILNLALKARIEKFLMEHSEHFKSVPRSLGSSRMRRRHASQFASHMCLPGSMSVGTYSTLSGVYKHQQRKTKSTVTATATSAFSGSLSPISPPVAKRARHSYSAYGVSATVTASSANQSPTTSSATGTTSSIDQALQQALQKITRFTQVSMPLQPSCINCRSGQFAYEIRTCRHLVCRECLVILSTAQQCVCKMSFQGADVERYHKLP